MPVYFFLTSLVLHKIWHDVLKTIHPKELLKKKNLTCEFWIIICYYLTQHPLESELQATVCYYTTRKMKKAQFLKRCRGSPLIKDSV